jgi:3-oxoadipate enol-lactonase
VSSAGVLAHRLTGTGAADPVLLMNGGLMTFMGWSAVTAALEPSRRVIGFDFRGQLLSPGVPPPSFDGHAADVVALLDHLGVARVDAVGTSFGALVGLVLAARHPERVRSLVVITATDRVTPEMWAAAQPLRELCRAAAGGGDGGAVLDLLLPATFSREYLAAQGAALALRRQQVAGMPRAWFDGVDRLLAMLEGLDLTPILGLVRCPTLVVAAGEDRTFPLAHSHALAAGICGARLEVVDRSGHGLVAEAPERLADLVGDFLGASS